MFVILTVLGIIALRLIDVSIGALRIQYLVRGRRTLAGVLGFFESLTWVLAAAIVLGDLDQWYKVAAYAAGFGLGTTLGSTLDTWIASGQVFVRVMAPIDSPQVAPALRQAGFGATVFNGEGFDGEVRLTLSAIPRRQLGNVMYIVKDINPQAYVTVDDVAASHAETIRAGRIRK